MQEMEWWPNGVLNPGSQVFVLQGPSSPHELVVLRQTFRPAWGTSLDLACTQSHYEVSDERVLSFSRAMTHHNPPAILLGQLAPAVYTSTDLPRSTAIPSQPRA